VLRIQAIMRRSAALPDEGDEVTTFSVGLYDYDYNTQSLQLNGVSHRLTTKENELLYMLCKHKNALLERSHALRNIWGDANYFNGRSMDVYIAKLRKHLRGDDRIEILNVHGKGFKLVAPTD
jgi:DNA-binding response OmpR family regulator